MASNSGELKINNIQLIVYEPKYRTNNFTRTANVCVLTLGAIRHRGRNFTYTQVVQISYNLNEISDNCFLMGAFVLNMGMVLFRG